MSLMDWVGGRVFRAVHQHNLVYNTCWEDPRLDRAALELGPDDTVLVITSAGCNTLDYALSGPRHIYAVDMNPPQNALLELKLAGIKQLDFQTFFAMFGRGQLDGAREVYHRTLRRGLSDGARSYWDRHIQFFARAQRRPFYFRGTSGTFAKLVNVYIDRIVRLRPWINAILAADSVSRQREIYDEYLRDQFWTRSLRFAMRRDTTLSLVGVPRAQRHHLERHYNGDIVAFVTSCIEAVFAHLPLADNYFWRVYLTGRYTTDCCPEYLKEANFDRLKDGLAERISVHTLSVQAFLDRHNVAVSRFVLLDHMDWLCGKHLPVLQAEWQAIVRRATPGARLIWRSGGPRTDFVDRVRVHTGGRQRDVGELLSYRSELAAQLHAKDRCHTYGGFWIADLAA